MGRRKRRVIRTIRKTLPKVFGCPRCGMISVRVISTEEGTVKIACGSCNLSLQYDLTTKKEPVDVYNEFVDRFMRSGVSF
jgi:transcription elongation factor Elf1